MTKRITPTPPKLGSRSPEEIQEAVRRVMRARSDADWEFLRSHPLDAPVPSQSDDGDED
jgi:hypothetical protein